MGALTSGLELERTVSPSESDERYDAFVSYARADGPFVAGLQRALIDRGEKVWLDVEYIPGGSKWQERIEREILRCKAFVFVVTDASLASDACQQELRQAVKLNKKIIPVRREADPDTGLPAVLSEREWVFLRPQDDFDAGVERLMGALRADLEWRDRLTELAERTGKWLDGGGELLRGKDLSQAEAYLVAQADHRERLTADQVRFIARSVQARKRSHRLRLVAVSVALLVTSIAAVIALIQRHSAVAESHTIESQLLATQAPGKQDLQLASLLAVDAYRTSPTVDARSAVLSVANTNELGAPLTGHTGQVDSVAFSPDGKTVASAGTDGTIRFWKLAPPPDIESSLTVSNQRAIGAPIRVGDTVFDIAYSRDGRMIASADNDHTVRLWDSTTHREIGPPLLGHTSSVLHVAFSPDGRLLASASADGTVRIWSLATRRQQGEPLRDGAPVLSVAFSPDGKTLATGDGDNGKVALWSVASHRQTAVLSSRAYALTHHGVAPSVAFSPDGRTLASASANGTVWLWDVPSRRQTGQLATYNGQVLSIAFSPDGQELAAAGYSDQITVWGLNTMTKRYVLTGHTNYVFSVAFSPDGTRLVSAGRDRTVRVWKNEPSRLIGYLPGLGLAPFRYAVMSPKGNLLAATVGTYLYVYGLPSGRPLEPDGVTDGETIWTLRFSPNGRILAASDIGGEIRLWDVATHRQLGAPLSTGPCSGCSDYFREKHRAFFGLAFSPDGKMLASSSVDGTVRLWSVATHREIGKPIVVSAGTVQSVAFAPSGTTLASTSGTEGGIRLWDVRTHRQLGPTMVAGSVVRDVAFSPDGTTLASADDDGTIRLWDAATHRQLGVPLTGDTRAVNTVRFSPDGKTLLSSSDDGSTREWNVASHQQLGPSLILPTLRPQKERFLSVTLTFHWPAYEPVGSATFSPDGRWIVAADDTAVGFWSNYTTAQYVRQLCAYINPRAARRLWQQSEPTLAYHRPC